MRDIGEVAKRKSKDGLNVLATLPTKLIEQGRYEDALQLENMSNDAIKGSEMPITVLCLYKTVPENSQPKSLIFWGQNDIFLTQEGGEAYLKDLPNAEMHRLDSGHFAVEDCLDEITSNIWRFYQERVIKVPA
jgi:pimeloyl-ACP methyl ester carboxylesterase